MTPDNPRNWVKVSKDEYNKMKPRDHVYQVPDTYIGSTTQSPHLERILNLGAAEGPQFLWQEITFPEGAERLFLEILSNSGDNVDRSRKAGLDPGSIEITATRTEISIKNYGRPIPIRKHETENQYIPDMTFGDLLTSSNHDQTRERTGAGRNGYGAKLTNIFSKKFRVEIGDSERSLKYTQQWSNNMLDREDPVIESYQGISYVQISYSMDFERFGYDQGYTDEALCLFAAHAADLSLTCKIPVYFNETKLDCQDIKKYTKWLYGEELLANSLVHIEKEGGTVPSLEVCLVDSPDEGQILSFVNGIITREGGVHVEAVLAKIKEYVDKIFATMGKKFKKDEDKGKKITLTKGDIFRHLSLVINCRIKNPEFVNQMKSKLSKPKPKVAFEDKEFKKMENWDLFNRLYAEIEAKKFRQLLKTDGKKKLHVKVPKAEDANLAGSNQSDECTLMVIEGKSAMGYAIKLIDHFPEGRDILGAYPLKGKPLNAMNASMIQLAGNDELSGLKTILGLREGVDYSLSEDFGTLRYGRLMVLSDSDDDGKHILGLVQVLFESKYPSLLKIGYITHWRTPIIRVSKGASTNKFYLNSEYLKWKGKNPDYQNWKHKYYKGLAGSEDDNIQDDYDNPIVTYFNYDDMASNWISLAFDKKRSHDRKDWIEQHMPTEYIDLASITVSEYVNSEIFEFVLANIQRSIPKFDGLKESQRKALWGAYKEWNFKSNKKYKEIKVGRLANRVADSTKYHHGETSMCDTIINMTHSFVGTNNLPYFVEKGQFGTRNENGKDKGAPRYISTLPSWWLPCVFKSEDEPILSMIVDEGEVCEPVVLLPIIPMGLVNGCKGIGSGYSTFIPNYNPLDIIQWLRGKLQDRKIEIIKPWYRGFKGTIEFKLLRKSELDDEEWEEESDEESDEEGNIPKLSGKYIQMTGIWKRLEKNRIEINEIPIGRSIHNYKNWLETLRDTKDENGKRLIKNFENHSKANEPRFIVTGMEHPSNRSLHLVKRISLTNMVMLNEKNRPIRFVGIIDILEQWFVWRFPYYRKRLDNLISEIESKIKQLSDRYKFIKLIIDKKLVVINRHKKEILKDLEVHQLPIDLLGKVSFANTTKDELPELIGKIDKLNNERERLLQTSPKQVWLQDLEDLENVYRKHYKL